MLQQLSADGEIGAERQLCPASIEKFGRCSSAVLAWVAGILAALALADSAVHLGPQHFPVSDRTLGLARRFLVQPKERADFGWLAAQPIWSGVKLRVLLDHVELAVYNRELINWTLDDMLYRDFVLSPGIAGEKQKLGILLRLATGGPEQKSEMAEGRGRRARPKPVTDPAVAKGFGGQAGAPPTTHACRWPFHGSLFNLSPVS